MSETEKRVRKPPQKFEPWTKGEKHAPHSIRKQKSREKAKGKEKREKQKMMKEEKKGKVGDKMSEQESSSGAGRGGHPKKQKKGK